MNGRNAVVNRTASVSERIAERLKQLRTSKDSETAPTTTEVELTVPPQLEKQDGEATPTPSSIDKGKGKALEETGSPLPMSPVSKDAPPLPAKDPVAKPMPILLAGIAMSPSAVSSLVRRAYAELPLRAVRLPILGEYPDCFTGEELVNWLRDNVEAFGGSLDLAAEAARGLGDDEGLLRRIGEIGNEFEPTPEAFYQFRPKAFNLTEAKNETSAVPANLQPAADNLLKSSGAFANFVMKSIKTSGGQPPHIRARQEAQEADHAYRTAVRHADRQRLSLEDRIEETFKLLQKWEIDRLRAVKDVLLKYHATVSSLPSKVQPSIDRVSTLIASYQPDTDLTALIERYRTGPFRPAPHVYESVSHDGTDVVFGIDLVKWAGEMGWAAVRVPEDEKKKDAIPAILASLLQALEVAYGKLSSDDERRRAWIYEIPLPILHHLREALNAQPLDQPIPVSFFEKVDTPVLAGVLKLWLLELNPPVLTWEGWEDVRKVYPTMGMKDDESKIERIEAIKNALMKLPKVHLYTLDAVIRHIKSLVDSTKSDEDVDVYLTKLAYSLGRGILRPRQETELSIQDRHPTYLFIDLVKNYDEILPPTIVRKKRESDKPLPMRKRTALVDQRINRRSVASDPKQLLHAREAQIRAPSPSPSRSAFPPVPPPPSASTAPAPTAPAAPAAPAPSTAPAPRADDGLPPRPKFTTPPPENDDVKAPVAAVVSPATPQRAVSPPAQEKAASPSSERSKSPVLDDKPIISTAASLSRSGSGGAAKAALRRPGGARGPRAAPGSTVAAAASPTSHRASGSFSSSSKYRPKSPPSSAAPADPKEYTPKKKDGRVSAGAFGRRAEDGSAQ